MVYQGITCTKTVLEAGGHTYIIEREDDPWHIEEGPAKPSFVVRVAMYGPFVNHTLKSFPTFAGALAYVKSDAQASTFVDSQCRWCRLEFDDLLRYPAWWFGCNLCEAEMDSNHRSVTK